ncbi:MAG: hypothetical protein HY040_18260 [Planctomycetes bacterium]|nr:hypothetical protein [Planctomycetota bacterium]
MVPILDQTIEGTKVSIFNEATHPKYPLLGLRLKNTSNQPLTQGPITVYDNSTYAGDTRILDFQPNEERLLSYALDQSTEIKTAVKATPSTSMNFRFDDATLSARYIMRETKTYTIKNRSTHDRTVILEHPIRADWKLAGTKPGEQSRDVYRFTVAAPSGKTTSFEVAEEQPRVDPFSFKDDAPRHAVLLGITVKAIDHRYEDKLVELKIQNDTLRVAKTLRESKSYFIQNLSAQDREFTVDHVVRPGWTLLDDTGAAERKGPGVSQFKLKVPKGKSLSKELVEEKPVVEQVALSSAGKPRYSLGLGLVVRTETALESDQLVGLKIRKGILHPTRKIRELTTYIVQNNSEEDREFLIDHVVRPAWTLLDEKGDLQKTGPDIFRFKLAVARGKPAAKELKEEHSLKDKGVFFKDISEPALQEYLSHPAISADVKTALAKALDLQTKATETSRLLAEAEKQQDVVSRDQARVRSNLQIIPQTSEHYKKFLEKFVAQETQIESLQNQIRQLKATLQKQQREYDQFLAALNVD